ncbi:MAG: CoA transferase [Burkholderiaceae bacterium]
MAADERATQQGFAPLAGVRIVDFSSNIAGPSGTMILALLGADVIKVESPQGDDARAWPLHVRGESVVHRYVNAGKRGVVIDLKTADGVEVAHRLCASADVVLQSMRPGVAERIGIDRATLANANPALLYYDLSGFGSGPLGGAMPGYDPLVQAFAGIVAMNGHDGTPPARCAPSVIDLGTGQWIAMGVLAAVLARSRGQPVRHLDTALVDTAFSLVPYQATSAKLTGRRPPRAGSGNPIAAPYQCYRASDGELLIAAPSQRLWSKLLEVLGARHLGDDPRFASLGDRVANVRELDAELGEILCRRPAEEWIAALQAAGIPVARIAGLDESVAGPIAAERATFAQADDVPLVRLPWLVDEAPVPPGRVAPTLGQHTAEVLAELGYAPAQIDRLIAGACAPAATSVAN